MSSRCAVLDAQGSSRTMIKRAHPGENDPVHVRTVSVTLARKSCRCSDLLLVDQSRMRLSAARITGDGSWMSTGLRL